MSKRDNDLGNTESPSSIKVDVGPRTRIFDVALFVHSNQMILYFHLSRCWLKKRPKLVFINHLNMYLYITIQNVKGSGGGAHINSLIPIDVVN